MLRFRQVVIALALAALCGCARDPVQRGTNLYAGGHFIEAAEVFERNENVLPDMSAEAQARYGLYRGLTLLVLGDLRGAHHWFSYARNIERRHPGALGEQRVALLERGSFELGNRIRRTPTPPDVRDAVAATPPGTTPNLAPAPEPTPSLHEAPAEQRTLVP